MSDLKKLAQDFISALSSGDPVRYEAVLNEEVGMRLNRWDGREIYRPRHRVIQRFKEEWSNWPDPTLESFDVLVQGNRVALEYRIQATENDRYVEHNRSVFLTIKDDKIETIDLYCPEPMPSARRKGWIAPATLTDDEVRRLLASIMSISDVREWISRVRVVALAYGAAGAAAAIRTRAATLWATCAGRRRKPINGLKKPSPTIVSAISASSGGCCRTIPRLISASGWNVTA